MPTSLSEFLAIPFRATSIAVYLENKATPETLRRLEERIFNTLLVILKSRIKALKSHTINQIDLYI
jgi:hypothetical protein